MTSLIRLTRVAYASAIFATLQGCASALTPLGENTYDCNRKENPASPFCHSYKAVEAATNGPLPDSRFDRSEGIAVHDRLIGIAPLKSLVSSDSHVSPALPGSTLPERSLPGISANGTAGTASLDGLPVRLGPVVQRIWVKRYVDDNDLLVTDTVIFKEVVGSRWLGFDAPSAGAGAEAKASNNYPHRPAAAAPTRTQDSNNREAPSRAAPRNGFVQPGARSPDVGDVVSAPATEGTPSESGVGSMPQ